MRSKFIHFSINMKVNKFVYPSRLGQNAKFVYIKLYAMPVNNLNIHKGNLIEYGHSKV